MLRNTIPIDTTSLLHLKSVSLFAKEPSKVNAARDLIIEYHDGQLKCISELHSAYLSFGYHFFILMGSLDRILGFLFSGVDWGTG